MAAECPSSLDAATPAARHVEGKPVMNAAVRRLALLGAVSLVASFQLACSSNDPEPAGAVAGVVRDADTGAPIAGAVIEGGGATVTTGADGSYSLPATAGSPTLSATAAGYVTTWRVATVASGATASLHWWLAAVPGAYWDYADPLITDPKIPADGMSHVILAWNDLGMHCSQDDYSYFLILPPFNTLHVQVVERGMGLVTSGIRVSYVFPGKADSTLHTDFWARAAAYDFAGTYGWNVTPNVGITGTPLAGDMVLDEAGLGWVARGIPVTPWNDDGTWNPYGTAEITVTDTTTNLPLQTATVVVPVSTELLCSNCHGTIEPFLNILQVHDRRSGTTLVADREAGHLHLCAECHADNALGLAGQAGVKNLSRAMHGFHADKVNVAADPRQPDCYNCHPGPLTQCLRGNMFHAGMGCRECHGDMRAMAAALDAGRAPWLEEPRCGGCHGAQYEENAGLLYRDSVLLNSPDTENVPSLMNGKLYCEGCHNSTHAEFRSTRAADASIPTQLQGDDYWIWNCYVCHTDYMPSPSTHLPW